MPEIKEVFQYSPLDPRAWPTVGAARLWGTACPELIAAPGDPRSFAASPVVRPSPADWRKAAEDLWQPQPTDAAEEIWYQEAISHDLIDGLFAIINAEEGPVRDGLRRLFYARLGWFDSILSERQYLGGGALSLADTYLFGILLTFDIGYRSYFPYADAAVVDYPHVWRYARDIYARGGLVTAADKRALGLTAEDDGTFAQPWGDFAWTETVADLREAWNAPYSSSATAASALAASR